MNSPVHPSLVIEGQHGLRPLQLELGDEPLQQSDGARDELHRAQGLQAAPPLPVLLHHQVINTDGGVTVTHVKTTS